jgi:hypothetical protein
MQLKATPWFIVSGEFSHPSAIFSCYVSRHACEGVLRPFTREPLGFGARQWFNIDDVGDDVLTLLSNGRKPVSGDLLHELEHLFGAGGEFEAKRLVACERRD